MDKDDPNYLFISDKTGRNFKQISPDNANVVNWQFIKETNKILMQIKGDTNGDKKFTDRDEAIPFVYDLETGGSSKEIFNDDYKTKLKKLFQEQWLD